MTSPSVLVRRLQPGDAEAYRAAVLRSRERIGRWNPVDPDGFAALLASQGAGTVTFFILDAGTGGIAGRVNVSNIIGGRAQSASIGYDAYDPLAGSGRMTEGLRLVLDRCFAATSDGGLGLHRIECNVQPANLRSVALARRVGFRLEGFSPRFLHLNGAWRDHERYALTAEEWPPAS